MARTKLNRDNPLKPKLNFKFDAFLLHLIQEVSRRPSAEILNFFNELAKQVADIGIENRTGSGIRKNIIDYFPGTSIPFHMLVKGHKYRNWNHGTDDSTHYMSCHVEIGFPEQNMHIKSQDLDEMAVGLMEQALLGGEPVNVAPFPRPEIRTPKMYKSLMEAFTKPKAE